MPSPDRTDPSLVGALLSRRYRLTKLVGSGAMGAVYETDQTLDGQPVAVKILHSEFVHEPRVKERFVAEARVLERLVHPNILRVFESRDAEDGTPYIVMELLQGVPLNAYTNDGGRVPLAQAIVILQGILTGLAAAHAQGIVHRDLKPENVFLARVRDAEFAVKLLDFGIAKVMDAAGGMGKKTKTGMLLGTPAYMSPEQVKDAKDVDARSDLYSAGVLFYEMLTGRTAFPAPTEYARLLAVLNTTPEPIEQIDPSLGALAPFMAKALDKNRDARFQSALEMSGTLAALAARAAPVSHAMPREMATLVDAPSKGPGGTLASPMRGEGIAIAPPPVVVVGGGGTLPSKELPMLEPVSQGVPRVGRGVSPAVLIALVVIALLAGFSIGFAVGRGLGA